MPSSVCIIFLIMLVVLCRNFKMCFWGYEYAESSLLIEM